MEIWKEILGYENYLISNLGNVKSLNYLNTKKEKNLTMTKFEATSKVQKIRHYNTDDEVCKKLGITKPTLYVRLKTNNWKVAEIYLIESFKL